MAPKEKLRAVQFWNQISEHLQVIVNNSASEINALASYLHEQETPSNPMNSSTSIVSKSPNHTNSTNNASSMTLEEQMPMLSDKNSIDFDIELAKQMTSESNTNHTGTNTETGNSTDPMNNAASELDSELNDFDLSAPTSMSIGNFIADESCLDEMQLIASPILTDQNQAQSDSHLSIFAYDQRPSLPSSVAVEDALNTSTSTHHLIDTASHPNFGISATGGQKCEASMMTVENRDKSTILVSNNDCDNPSTTHVVHERRFQCELCGARFTAKHSLLVHVRRHTGERPFACDHCGRTFAQSSVLKAHLDTHLGDRKYECGVCGKKFSQRPQLRLHLQRHNGERRWACSSCDARFVTRADLTRHALSHSGQKPFACTLCEKRFTRKQALEEHSNRHFGIRPYSCALCDKQFVEQSAYNKVSR